MRNRRRAIAFAAAATAAVAAATLVTSSSAATASARYLSAVSGATAPETADISVELRVNRVGYATDAPKVAFARLAFALGAEGGSGLG
jgi:hypothetical protein